LPPCAPSRWKKYKQRFELLCTAIGVGEEKQKIIKPNVLLWDKHATNVRKRITLLLFAKQA